MWIFDVIKGLLCIDIWLEFGKGGILGRGEEGGGLKGMLLCFFIDCVGIKCLMFCGGNDEVFD